MQMRRVLFVMAVAGGCGNVEGTSSVDARRADTADQDAVIDLPSPDAMVVDRSCSEVKARLATTVDGTYWIDPDLDGTSYKPFQVYCAGMATATPEEFLELRHASAPADMPPASNFSTYATGNVHGQWTCDCGVLTSLFTKVRIDRMTLKVSSDARFTVYSNSTNVACMQSHAGCPGISPYGIAQSCLDAANGPNKAGSANIDLRDVPFHVAGTGTDTSMFTGMGFIPAGTVTIDAARKIVDITGGGDCGGWGAYAGLQLAQDL